MFVGCWGGFGGWVGQLQPTDGQQLTPSPGVHQAMVWLGSRKVKHQGWQPVVKCRRLIVDRRFWALNWRALESWCTTWQKAMHTGNITVVSRLGGNSIAFGKSTLQRIYLGHPTPK